MQRRFLGSWCALAAVAGALYIASPAPADVEEAAKALLAATVTVEIESAADASTSTAEADNSQSGAGTKSVLAVASGTVVAPQRIVIAHMADNESADYYVRPGRGRRFPAKVLVTDRRSGLKLLQAEEGDVRHLTVAEEPAAIGQRVLAAVVYEAPRVRYIRQPQVLSVGIIAADERRAEGFGVELLQTDLRAGVGSAGAPLADEEGRLLGILVAGDVSRENDVTLAVPARYVLDLLAVERGEKPVVIHPAYMGVQLEPSENEDGAKVVQVFDSSPAAKAGIQAGDVVTAFDGHEVRSPEDLTGLVGRLKSGVEATVKLQRGEEEREVGVELGQRPQPDEAAAQEEFALELTYPGRYRVVPLGDPGTSSQVNPQTLQALSTLLQQAQKPQPSPQEVELGVRKTAARSQELTPLTVYVQRPQADQRLDRLAEEVKTLSEEMKKVSEQLEALSSKLEKPAPLMTREEAIESLRKEFLEKLDDLVRQKNLNQK